MQYLLKFCINTCGVNGGKGLFNAIYPGVLVSLISYAAVVKLMLVIGCVWLFDLWGVYA